MTTLKVGTRGSALALWQARHVIGLLKHEHPMLETEIVVVHSDGDLEPAAAIDDLDGTGVFVRRLERALANEEIDIAVHSLKDLPTELRAGLTIGAVPVRHDARDALVAPGGVDLVALPPGARVGTGSPRRRAQLLHTRPDLVVSPVRGNVDTRLAKLESGEYHAMVLAVAGLERLKVRRDRYRPLDAAMCVPAPGQGALAVEVRERDEQTCRTIGAINDPDSVARVTAERAFLQRIGAGCHDAVGAHAVKAAETLTLDVRVADRDGRVVLGERETGRAVNAATIGARLAERLLVAGAEALLGHSPGDDARS